MITLKVFFKTARKLNPKPEFFLSEKKDGFLTDSAFFFFKKFLENEEDLIQVPSQCISLYIKDGINWKLIENLESPLLEKEEYYCLVTPGGNWDAVRSGGRGALDGAVIGGAIGSIIPGIGTAIGAFAGGLIGGGVSLMLGLAAEQQDDRAEAEQLRVEKANREFSQLDQQSPIKGTQFIKQQSPSLDPIQHDNRVNPGSPVPESFGTVQVKARGLSPMFQYAELDGQEVRENRIDLEATEYFFIEFFSCGEGKYSGLSVNFNGQSRGDFNSHGYIQTINYNPKDIIDLNRLKSTIDRRIDRNDIVRNVFGSLASNQNFTFETALLVIRNLKAADAPRVPVYGVAPTKPRIEYERVRLADGSRGESEVPDQRSYERMEDYYSDVAKYNQSIETKQDEYKEEVEAFNDYNREMVKEQNEFKQAAVNTNVLFSRLLPDYTQEPAITAESITSNPAVIAAYLLQSIVERSNAPVTLADIADLSAFREWKNFCTTKELEFNGSFDFEATAFQALKAVFFVGMAEIDTSFGKVRPIIKETRAVLNQIFHSRNIRNLQYSKIGRRLPEKITGSFINKDKNYKPDEVAVFTTGGVAGAHPPGTYFDITSGLVKAGVFGYSRLAGNAAHLKGGSLSTDENLDLLAAYLEDGKSKIVTRATADKLSKLWIDNAVFALNRTKDNLSADGTWGNAAYDEYEATDESGAALFNRGAGRYFRQTPLGIENLAGVFKIGYALISGLSVANDGFRGAQPAPSSGDNDQYGLVGKGANYDAVIASKGPYFLGAHGVYKPNAAGEIDNSFGAGFCNWYLSSAPGAQKVTANLVGFDPRAVAYSPTKIFVLFDNRDRKQSAAAESFKIGIFDLATGGLTSLLTLTEARIGQILGAANQDLALGLAVVRRTITIRENTLTKNDSITLRGQRGSTNGFMPKAGFLKYKAYAGIATIPGNPRITQYVVSNYSWLGQLITNTPPDIAGIVKNSDKAGSSASALYSYSGTWRRVEINGVEHALGAREIAGYATNDDVGESIGIHDITEDINTIPIYRQEFTRFDDTHNIRFKDASEKWWPAPAATLTGTKRPFPAQGLAANGENISLCIGGLLNAKTIKNGLITIDTTGNYISGQYALGITGKIAVLGNFIYNIPFIPASGQIAAYYANSVFKTPLASGAASVVAAFDWTAAGRLTRAVRLEKEAGGFMMFGQRVHTARSAREEKRISLFGVTSETQAKKYLNLQKRMLEKLFESWSFETDIQAIVARRGDKVGLNHYEISKTQFTSRIAGFVKNAGGMITGIQIDQSGVPVLEPGKNYGCKVISESASPDFAVTAIAEVSAKDDRQNIQTGAQNLETRAREPIRVRPKLYKTLRLTAPQAAAGFAPKVGDYIVFGETANKFKECLVQSISMDKNLRARVTLVPYIESIYSQI